MSFFRRKDKGPAIPLPPSEQPSYGQQSWQPQEKPAKHDEARAQLFAGAPSSSSSSTNRSYSSGSPYDSGGGAAPDPYASRTSRNVLPPSSDPYAARGAAPRDRPQETDPSRAALFAGYNPAAIPREQGRRQYADQTSGGAAGDSAGGMHQTQEDEDEDVEMIKRDMRGVKQETLGSSRNALRIALEAEETARTTLGKLGDQSEKIANTERNLDLAKASSSRADDKTDELRKLNRSIFIPVVTFNKDAKNQAKEQRITDRHIEETAERHKARLDVEQTQRRLNDRSLGGSNGRGGPTAGAFAGRKEARAKYQFEATASDDELEDELDDNLDETLDVTKRLKALATAAGDEIKTHNERLIRINDKAEGLDLRIQHNNERLKRIN